jgi:PKD domain-containing protein
VFASDGNLTNLSATFVGPDVWTNVSVVSADGLSAATFQALGPTNVSVSPFGGVLPLDPTSLVAISLAYRVNATFLAAANFSVSISFSPSSQVNRSTALVFRADAGLSQWISLVTQLDLASNTASIPPGAGDLPGVFRVFARRAAPPVNEAPALVITIVGQAHPNSTMLFDGANSTDPEGATVLLAWHFQGPGLDTPWIPGAAVLIAFPQAGFYDVSLQAEDGSGNVVFQNSTLQVTELPPPAVENPLEAEALAALAVAVVAAGVLSRWWRGRRPAKKPAYDDLYGQAYKRRLTEEREYTQLFERFAAPEGETPPPEEPPREP